MAARLNQRERMIKTLVKHTQVRVAGLRARIAQLEYELSNARDAIVASEELARDQMERCIELEERLYETNAEWQEPV